MVADGTLSVIVTSAAEISVHQAARPVKALVRGAAPAPVVAAPFPVVECFHERQQTATIQPKPRANASWQYEVHMSCRHRASQLASFGQLLELGPWAAQPSVESAGGMVDLPRWTAESCALAATSTTRPLVRHLT